MSRTHAHSRVLCQHFQKETKKSLKGFYYTPSVSEIFIQATEPNPSCELWKFLSGTCADLLFVNSFFLCPEVGHCTPQSAPDGEGLRGPDFWSVILNYCQSLSVSYPRQSTPCSSPHPHLWKQHKVHENQVRVSDLQEKTYSLRSKVSPGLAAEFHPVFQEGTREGVASLYSQVSQLNINRQQGSPKAVLSLSCSDDKC